MELQFLNSIRNSIKHWYVPLIVGILFVVMSILAFAAPLFSLATLALLFSLSFMFGGLSEVIFSISSRKELDNWGWSLAFGIITFIVGISLVMNLGLAIGVLAFYIGFLLLFRSIASIGFALDVKKYGSKNWIGLLIFGILGAIVSFILIWNPIFAGLSVVVLVALSFLFTGIFSIILAFQLRKLHKSSKTISANLKDRYDVLMEDIRKEQENQ